MKKLENEELDNTNEESGVNNAKNTSKRGIAKTIKKRAKKTLKKIDSDIVTKNYDFNLLEVVIIILITGIVVSFASGLIVYTNYANFNKSDDNNKSTLEDDQFLLFKENYDKILNTYVNDVDKDELLDAAISGMYDYLGDNYSVYMDEESTQSLNDQLKGKYTGIGVEIQSFMSVEDGSYSIFISRIFENSPASEAGLMVGDQIIELNGISLKDKDGSYVSSTIKNSDEATHTLKVIRNESEELTLTLTRKEVVIDSVTSKVIDNVAYLKIETFSQTAPELIKKYLKEYDDSIKSIVIDVRDNTGGYLNSAYSISDMFLDKDKVIYKIKDREEKITNYFASEDAVKKFDKIAVLVNENSASASEVLTLALKESANAIVVGTTTFGKGTIQDTEQLSNGSMIKITTGYWLSPNGNSIDKKGIVPDILVENVDEQLNEAIKAVK